MKRIVPMLVRRSCRNSFLICLLLVVALPTFVSSEKREEELANGNDDTVVSSTFSKQPEISFSGHRDDSTVNDNRKDSVSARMNDEADNSALNKFLENVLKAENELRWIDETVRDAGRRNNWKKSVKGDANKYSHLQDAASIDNDAGNKLRDKRAYDQSYENPWYFREKKYEGTENRQLPKRIYLNDDMTFKNDVDSADSGVFDPSQDRLNRPVHEKGTLEDQDLKYWKSVHPSSDWWNSNKKGDSADKSEDRRMRSYNDDRKINHDRDQKVDIDSTKRDERKAASFHLNEPEFVRRETKREETPLTLESLKETILELKKSLVDGDKKSHGGKKRGGTVKTKENEGEIERRSREQKKNRKHKHVRSKNAEFDQEEDENPETVRSDAEEELLKMSHDRKRRSKDVASEEKLSLNQSQDKINPDANESSADSAKTSKKSSESDACDVDRKSTDSGDLKEAKNSEENGESNVNENMPRKTLENRYEERKNSKGNSEDTMQESSAKQEEERKNVKQEENGERMVPSSKNLDTVETKFSTVQRGGANLEGNSIENLGTLANELRIDSAKTCADTNGRTDVEEVGRRRTEGKEENIVSGQREQVIKVFEPQGQPYENSKRTKEVERIETDDEEHRKLSRQLSQAKRTKDEPRNINIVVESENKLVKLSNGASKQSCLKNVSNNEGSLIMNTSNLKKELIVEKEEGPGASVATIFNVNIKKTQIDSFKDDEKGKRSVVVGLSNDVVAGNVESGRANDESNELRENEPRCGTDLEQKEGLKEQLNVEKLTSNDDSVFARGNKISDERKMHLNGEKNNVLMIDDVRSKKPLTSQRKLLEYVEYSDDDVEDADSSYSDEEDDEQDENLAGQRKSVGVERKERSAMIQNVDPKVKAKVNVLIKEKLDKKNRKTRDYMRTRRNPMRVIEYYDYDADVGSRSRDAPLMNLKEEEVKNNHQRNSIQSGLAFVPAENPDGKKACPPIRKYNENEKEWLKQEKENEKTGNKGPKEIIVDLGQPRRKNVTGKAGKPSNSLRPSSKVKLVEEEGLSRKHQPGRLDQGEDNVNGINRGRLNEEFQQGEDSSKKGKCMGNNEKSTSLEAETQSDKNENDKPLYEELEKLSDSNDNELMSKSRLKGNQRMYEEDDRSGKNSVERKVEDQDSSSDSPSDLSVSGGSRKSEIQEKTYVIMSIVQSQDFNVNNNSGSSNIGIKDNGETVKHQTGQSDKKKRGEPVSSGQSVKCKIQEVPKEDKSEGSLKKLENYEDTDSRSPYETHHESHFLINRIKNIDNEKQPGVNSLDLHESFIEPVDWIDDSDSDIRVRLGRGLKSIKNANFNTQNNTKIISNKTTFKKKEYKMSPYEDLTDSSNNSTNNKINPIFKCNILKPAIFPIAKISTNDVSTLLSNEPDQDYFRPKREVVLPYHTFYDDMDQHQRDSDGNDYRYPMNREIIDSGLQLPNSYGNVDRSADRTFNLNWSNEPAGYDFSSANARYNPTNYRKRNANARKRRRHRKGRKDFVRASKKHTRKGHHGGSKYIPSSSRRKRGHVKESWDVSNVKKRKSSEKKHKKNASKNLSYDGSNGKNRANDNERHVHRARHAKPKYEAAMTAQEMIQEHEEVQRKAHHEDDAQRKKISLLLAADNIEDESQMNSAIHGELAGKIVEQIFQQVGRVKNLKTSLGPGLSRSYKPEDAITADQTYRRSVNEDEVKHTEDLMRKVIELLNKLIFDEVQRKTCVSLPPDLREFLDWMLDINREENSVEETPPLPFVHEESAPENHPQDEFLFGTSADRNIDVDVTELTKKLRVLKGLIKEYNALTEREKTKVQRVHDYLVKQLDLLAEYIEAMEKSGRKEMPGVGAARGRNGSILQYQIAMNNRSNGNSSMPGDRYFSLINMPNISQLSNVGFDTDDKDLHDDSGHLQEKRRRKVRTSGHNSRRNKKHKKRKKRRKKHGKNKKNRRNINYSKWHEDLEDKTESLRRKRAFLEDDPSETFDSGYEEPLMYNSMDMAKKNLNEINDDLIGKEKGGNEMPENTQHRKNAVNQKLTADYSEGKEINRVNLNDYSNLNHETSHATNYFLKKREIPWIIESTDILTNQSALKAEGTMDRERNTLSPGLRSLFLPTEKEDDKNTVKGAQGSSDSVIIKKPEYDISPVKGKNRMEDELILLNKRQEWKKENVEQLEEVAFGKDMRNKSREEELFGRLTEIDKKKNIPESDPRYGRRGIKKEIEITNANISNYVSSTATSRILRGNISEGKDQETDSRGGISTTMKQESKDVISKNYHANNQSNANGLSSEDKLRILEQSINVYSDNDRDAH